MDFIQRAQKMKRKNGELRIIGAISIDLNEMSDEMNFNEMNESTRIQVAHSILKEFCSNSSVHGVRYFTERKRHWIERVWWIVAVSLSLSLSAFTIHNIWSSWRDRPVVVTFDDKTTPIGMIPFPAITVCPTKKFIIEKIDVDPDEFIKTLIAMESNKTAYKNLSPENLDRLDAVLHVCSKEVTNLVDGLIIPRSESILKTIEKMSPELSSVIVFATFSGTIAHFQPIFTAEGLCFTFNSLNSQDIYTNEVAPELMTVRYNQMANHWSAENGYDSNTNESDVYPYRVFGSGARDVFGTVLGITVDESEKFCSELSPGFRLSLHMPDELPRQPDDFIFIPIEQEIFMSIKPNVIMTSNGLRGYSSKDRGCFFKSERQLQFFKLYSQQNCESECVANFTQLECGCVKFSMPRDKYTEVCTMVDIKCYINARDRFSKELQINNCNCLPDCTSVTYDVETSQVQSQFSDRIAALRYELNETTIDVNSKLFIAFKESSFISINRTEAYTYSDFIASCGGLLGLFMGISLLSVIELIYYLTLRLCCKLKQQRKARVKQSTWAKRKHQHAMKNHFQTGKFNKNRRW